MDKINQKRISIFLTLGIIIFVLFIYLFIKYEILDDHNHTVKIYSIRVTENTIDSTTLKKIKKYNDSSQFVEHFIMQYHFSLINKFDNNIYAESENFNDKTSIESQIIRFNETSLIPIHRINDKYDIILIRGKRNVLTFPIKSLNILLNLKNKDNYLTEEKEIEITSTTKKVKILAKFIID
ncbi:MAG TPA: hypothetical protein PK431_02260 [Chitinophagales bacterium]|nr:hypothetical protein [Chitinophagales bacterium]